MDMNTAYLYAPIDEIFLEQPEVFKQGDGDMVCELKRSLYGLKQSGCNYYECLEHRLKHLGFQFLQQDKCLWTQKGATIIAGHCCGSTTVSTVQPVRTLDDGLKQRFAISSQQVTLALLRGSRALHLKRARRFDVKPRAVHIKLADEIRNVQLEYHFNSLIRQMCTQLRRPAERRLRGSF